jgi:multisubunit Na+/H+ antiporter MnhE subunit
MVTYESERYLVVTTGTDRGVIDAVREVRDAAVRRSTPAEIEILVPDERRAEAIEAIVGELDVTPMLSVETTVTDDPAALVESRTSAGTVACILIDPSSELGVRRLETTGVRVERLSVPRETRHRQLVHERELGGFLLTFVLSYGFYLLLGDPTDPFDLVTGVVTAGVVAGSLSAVVVDTKPSFSGALVRSLRATAFLPYLLYEIVKANLGVAYVILHPDLPIDPKTVSYDPGTEGRFERAVLANAITLTPGTLTVDANGDSFSVHALTDSSRAGLEAGSLRRAVHWVFHGGSA